jgi:DNA-binding CsgD family transcriptional regulator
LPVLHGPAFTGRGSELAALTAALAGRPAVVLVDGEAGIGKSRLIGEFCASPAGQASSPLVGCCPPFRTPHTLGPVADAVRQAAPDGIAALPLSGLAGALRPLFPEWAPGLPPAPEPAEDATAARHRLFTALAELLACLDVGVLVVEDMHWADDATVEFPLYLASRRPRPGSLVVTCRPEDVPAASLLPRLARLAAGDGGLRLALDPLDVAGTAALMSSMLAGEHVSDEFAAFVHEHTEGIPLAVEESVRLMASRGDLARRGDTWVRHRTERITVPPTIRDAVLERAAQLTPDAQAVLRAAAVLAAPAAEVTVQAVTGFSAERLRAGLAYGLTSGLLAEDTHGLVAFRHALAARAVAEAVAGPERRLMHQRAGEALEDTWPTPLARLTRHFREAGDTLRWSRYAERAAEVALAAGDEAGAGELLADLVIGARLPAGEAARLTGKIVLLALPGDGRLRDLVPALRSALDALDLEPGPEAELRFQLGRILLTMDEHEAGRAELERAVSRLRPGSVQAVRAMTLLGWPHGMGVPVPVRVRWLRRAAQAAGSLEPGERLRLQGDRAFALLALGEPEGWVAADAIPDLPSGAGERLQVTRGHANLGEMAMTWGRYGEVGQRLARARELAGTYGYSLLGGSALAYQAHLDWLTGAWDGLASRAAALSGDERLSSAARLQAVLVTGLLDAAAGDRGRAEDRLRQVLGETLRRGAVEYALEPAAALARLALADAEAESALKVTEDPARIIAQKGTWIWAAELAPARVEALAAAGRDEEAESLVRRFTQGLRGRDAPAPKAALLLCRAILAEARGEQRRAATLFGRAAAAWQALPRPYDALLARERQARALLATDRPEAALAVLTEVQLGLSELGARRDADRVARTMRERGMTVPRVWRGGRRGYGSQLSPRELEVAWEAAAGRTNKEIAAALSRSPRTVEMQLYSAMRKLGVPTRAALIAHAARGGLTPGGPLSAEPSHPR